MPSQPSFPTDFRAIKSLEGKYKGKTTRPVDQSKMRVKVKPTARKQPEVKTVPMASPLSVLRTLGGVVTNWPQGAYDIATILGPAAVDYFRRSSPSDVVEDVKGGLSSYANYFRENPGEALTDLIPLAGDAKAFGEMIREASLAREAGDEDLARAIESYTLPVVAAGLLPEVGGAVGAAARKLRGAKAAPLAVKEPKITFPDEGEWELPDLDENVAVYTAPVQRQPLSVPAKAAPPRAKIKAYHGTPHRFQPETKLRQRDTGQEGFVESVLVDPAKLGPDVEIVQQYPLGRFSMDKIGTGEGAQAYGHGLYFAEEPKVARGYRDANLRHDVPAPTIGGQDAYAMYADLLSQGDALPYPQAQTMYDRSSLIEDLMHAGDTLGVREILAEDPNRYSPEAVDWYKQNVEPRWSAPGSLYEVELDVDPAKMLAWDVPVAEQPEVMQSLLPLIQKYQIEGLDDTRYPSLGGDLYHQLRLRSDVRDSAMSDLLTSAGVPGIRYLDQGSRSSGKGTENYVMMNPDLIEILKRYREGGTVNKV